MRCSSEKPGGAPSKLELEVWSRCVPEVKLGQLKRTSLWGGRRVCRLALPDDFRVEVCEDAGAEASALALRSWLKLICSERRCMKCVG